MKKETRKVNATVLNVSNQVYSGPYGQVVQKIELATDEGDRFNWYATERNDNWILPVEKGDVLVDLIVDEKFNIQYKQMNHEVKTLENQPKIDFDADNRVKRFEKIRSWATERGLYEKGDPKTQFVKLMEEAGELGRGILKDDQEMIVDALGDTLVVLINLSELCGYQLEDCLDYAYQEIKDRKGSMKNGTFAKN